MDLAKVLQQLHAELENLNAAIASLERLQEAGIHRGKAPDWMGDIAIPAPRGRKRKNKAKSASEAPEKALEPGVQNEGE